MTNIEDKTSHDGPGDSMPAQAALLRAVRHGWSAKVPRLVKDMTPAERRGCLPALTALRKEVRQTWAGTNWRSMALIIAGAACHTAPSGAAQWINSTGSSTWTGLWLGDDVVHLLAVLSRRDPEWIADVATRLADRRSSTWEWPQFPLVERLLLLAGCPIPTFDGFVATWMEWSAVRHRNRPWDTLVIQDGEVVTPNSRKKARFPNDATGTDAGAKDSDAEDTDATGTIVDGRVIAPPRRSTLVDRLRTDPFLDDLVPRIFEVPDAGAQLLWWPATDHQWPQALATLAAEGRLDRGRLLDACLSRLLRGDRQANLRGFVAILDELAPTLDEQAARATTYLRMLPDSHSMVAGIAQQTLMALDGAGRLGPELLIEASRLVLCRPEKKLVRAQLSWLDKTAPRYGHRSGEIALAAAEAFSHEDTSIAERALTLVGRHHRKAGETVFPGLLAAAATLNPALHARAAELLGIAEVPSDPAFDMPADLLPPAPEPTALGPAIQTAAEVAEEVAAIIATRYYNNEVGVATFERALDGLVRHAHHDREELIRVLKPIGNPYSDTPDEWGCAPENIGHVVAALTNGTPADKLELELHKHWRNQDRLPLRTGRNRFDGVLTTRLLEISFRIVSDRPPFLLATPCYATGRIDPDVLVDRLRAYEKADVEPGRADFDQALLRVGRDCTPEVLAEAARLTSPAGERLATWLRLGGLPDPEVEHLVQRAGPYGVQLLLTKAASITPPVELSKAFAPLLHFSDGTDFWGPFVNLAAILPEHRDLVAMHFIHMFADAADADQYRASRLLPVLAEAGGPAGQAVHLGLAYGLGGKSREWRTAAVDALLVLAARGDLDAATLGRDLAEIVRLGAVKPNRLAESVREAARTGAYGTVWQVLAAALPGLLGSADITGRPLPGLADILAVAAECARRSGARDIIPEVSALADRSGSSRLIKEARLLRDILAQA